MVDPRSRRVGLMSGRSPKYKLDTIRVQLAARMHEHPDNTTIAIGIVADVMDMTYVNVSEHTNVPVNIGNISINIWGSLFK